MKKIVTVAAATMLVASANTARAQDVDLGAIVAYAALNTTPIGALPPALSSSMLNGTAEGWGLQTRYGYMSVGESALHNLGIGVDFRAPWSGNVGITLGYGMPGEEGAESYMMLGAGWQSRITSSDVGGAKLNVGVQTDLGYSKHDDVNAIAAAFSVPVAFVAGSGSWSYAPFLSPGFGFGRLSDEIGSESGTRFLLGGGIALNSPSRGMAFNVGVQKVFIEEGDVQFGVGLTWHPGR